MSRDSLNIDVYHKGVFSPNPFVYFHPDKLPVMGLDVRNMDFKEFMTYLQKLINNRCRDMYYCLKNRSLVDGLRELRDEDDYVRFLDAGFDDDDNQISVYIDDYHEPLLDWIEEEKVEEGDSGTETYEDDVDSVLSDDLAVDHEADDEDIQWLEVVDPFLSQKNLIPEKGIEDEAGDKVKKHPIHDPNQKWDTMMPELANKETVGEEPVGEEGDVEEGVGEEPVGEEGVGEEPVGEEGDVEEGVGQDGVGEEGAIEEGDIEDHQEDEIDHQEDEIDHQEDEIDHQEDHVEDHQENHVKDHQEAVVQDEAHHIEVVQDEVDHHELVVEVDHHEPIFDEVDHHQHQPVFFQHFVANKRRLPSERITKLKLRKKVVTKDGSGESHENPVTLN
ncbi:unnamed protein product [Lactuca virosa]|uniref:Uncharacterized protein n=1 Tax=Lactuca virosa TaxID=75947 RepID=A0AAU9PB46_9ASTR|nr:unnamed protein product [Lactuca virosa]